MAHGPEDIRKHVRVYISVFVALMVLTVMTVAVASLHLNIVPAVTVAISIAIIKGSLVALFFMHLIDERKGIYATLALTAVFFLFLMALPSLTGEDATTTKIHREAPAAPHH
jgi:cytochrome c oxidase subunit 4